MPVRTAEARWQRSLQDGSGTMRLGSGAFEGSYSFKSRMEDGPGTNPEELIGAAHAGCFSMAFANGLSQAGHKPQEIRTVASVHFDKTDQGWGISRIDQERCRGLAFTDEGDAASRGEGTPSPRGVARPHAGHRSGPDPGLGLRR